MKFFLLSFALFGLFYNAHAQESLLINDKKYSLTDFKKNYATNIEAEGYENALTNYVNYILLLQEAQKEKVDTTTYFKNLYNAKLAELKRDQLDKMVFASLKDSAELKKNLSIEEKIKILNQLVIDSSANYLKYDSLALKAVIKAAGEDFITRKDSLNFKGDKWIYKTPTGEFSQIDLAKSLNFAQKNIEENISLSDLIESSLFILRNQFIINDYQNNFEFYRPDFKQEAKELKDAVLINYILETNVYQKYKGKELDSQLNKYLKEKQEKYTWPVRYEVDIIRYFKPELKSKIQTELKKNSPADKIQEKFNQKYDDVVVVVNHGKFPIDHEVFGKNFNPTIKIQEGFFRKTPTWIRVIKTIPSTPMTVKEADQVLVMDFNNYLLQTYFSNLNKNAKIKKVNENH